MIVYIFNGILNKIERYVLDLYDPMPYTRRNSLTVKDFRSSSRSLILWSTTEAMHGWSSQSCTPPLCAFSRIAEGGHIAQSNHYAGLAFDTPCGKLTFPSESTGGYGYPLLSCGDIGVYVFVLQDALYTLGISPAALDGFFGPMTRKALMEFQRSYSLPESGQSDHITWAKLTFLAAGAGCVNKIPYLL